MIENKPPGFDKNFSQGQTPESFRKNTPIEHEVVPPIFRLGQAITRQETIIDDMRVLSWELVGNEEEQSRIAGWSTFQIDYDRESNTGNMYIPEGTRNAKSVLAGKEAWDGEKRTVVEAVAKYISNVKQQKNAFDVGLAWNTVGITPNRNIFVAPPNYFIELDPGELEKRYQELTTALDLLLQNDEKNRELPQNFKSNITEK
jgi:hypothetical protein